MIVTKTLDRKKKIFYTKTIFKIPPIHSGLSLISSHLSDKTGTDERTIFKKDRIKILSDPDIVS